MAALRPKDLRAKEDIRDGLSKKEQAVLSYLSQGLSDKEIALALDISPRTVQKHLQHIYRHFDVRTRAQAIMRFEHTQRKPHRS